jgi:O-antigen biosynthesis protein WbqP
MKRIFDIVIAFGLLILLSIPMIAIALVVRTTSKGSSIHLSKRIGKEGVIFQMPKFRSMYVITPEVSTHELKNSDQCITPVGRTIRKFSLDELPQLYSILKGDMSLVGPRPALYNQYELNILRTNNGVDKILPGITGWAQVNGRDKLSIVEKVELDTEYLNHQSFQFDMKIIFMTILQIFKFRGILH